MKKFFCVCLLLFFCAACTKRYSGSETLIVSDSQIPVEIINHGHLETIPVNDITVLSIVDATGVTTRDKFAFFDKYPDMKEIMPESGLPGVFKTYLVRTGDRKVLVDTGWGSEQGQQGDTVKILASQGIKPGDITDIILTHMDVDHIGGLVRNGTAVFPKATLWVSKQELDAWLHNNPGRSKEAIAKAEEAASVYGNNIRTFEFDEEIIPGITARNAVGHTPGHTAYEIASGDEALMIVGDLLHVWQIQMKHPDVCLIYDGIPSRAAFARKDMLERIVKENKKIAGMHFPQTGKLRHISADGFAVVAQ